MKNILEKIKADPKGKVKVELGLYLIFFVIVFIYSMYLGRNTTTSDTTDYLKPNEVNEEFQKENIIKVPENYEYNINVNINNKEIKYSGIVNNKTRTIIKEQENEINNYKYDQGKYYIETNDMMIITTKEEIYDTIDYNYLDINNINQYLLTAKKDGKQYIVYLKNIILGHDDEKYFIINLNDEHIVIDYKPLFEEFDKEIEKAIVDIEIKEIIE